MVNQAETTATWDVLRGFGFWPDDTVHSDVMPGLSFDFGNFKLSASWVTTLRFAEVVLFTGAIATPRTIAEVQFEMPRRVKSPDQCAAWIVWHLDKVGGDGGFVPAHPVKWLAEGRNHRNLLPWIADMAEYKARPHCEVQREWLRVALKSLGKILTTADDEAEVVFGFDGAVLTIRCVGKIVAMSGEGTPWRRHYTIPAEKLRNLPKRLMREWLEVSVWEGRLTIGRNSYAGVLVAESSQATKTNGDTQL